jgi:hypothetical protein
MNTSTGNTIGGWNDSHGGVTSNKGSKSPEVSTDSGLSLEDIPAELLMALLDNPYESLILIDAEGIIRFMSSSNEGIYPIPVKDAIGRINPIC